MSGSNDFSNATQNTKQRLGQLENELDNYVDSLGLSGVMYNTDVSKLLEMTQDELKMMSEEDCAHAAYMLAQYGLFLRRSENRQLAIQEWAKHNLDIMVAKEAGNYCDPKYTKYEEKVALVSSGDGYANALSKIILSAKAKYTEIKDTYKSVYDMQNAISRLQQSKRYKK